MAVQSEARDIAATRSRPRRRRTPTSSSAPSSTTSGRRSPCCCSRASTPLGVAWLRIAAAALVFAAWRRPWRGCARSTAAARSLAAWGAGRWRLMNCCFYLAIDRLPLGTVAAIEFLPGGRAGRARRAHAAQRRARSALAVAGVVPAHATCGSRGEPLGFAFAFANAVLFALYIVLGHRVAREPAIGGIDGLGRGDAGRRASSSRRSAGSAAVPALHRPGRAGSPASASASPRRSSRTSATSSRWRGCRARPTR